MVDHPTEPAHTVISDPKYLAAQNTLNRMYSRMSDSDPNNLFKLRIGVYSISFDTSCVFDRSATLTKFPGGEKMDIDPREVYRLLRIFNEAMESF